MASDLRLKEHLPALTDEIVETYTTVGSINHLGHCPLPKYEEVVAAVQDLKDILYPGYRRREGLHIGNVTYHVGDLIDGLHDTLTTQIARALQHEARVERGLDPLTDKADYSAQGQRMAITFLQRIPELRRQLAMDVQAAYDGDPAAKSYEEIVISYPCITAIATHRIAHELFIRDVPLIPRIMAECAHARTGIDIHPGATIGRNFFIDHGTGVVIGETSIIGDNVKIYQGTTLGALSFRRDERGRIIKGGKRHPTIEDNVTIYAEATILGDVTIGRGAVIGGNTWVKESVPPGVTVSSPNPDLLYRKIKKHKTKKS